MTESQRTNELHALHDDFGRLSTAVEVLIAKQDGMTKLIEERWKSMENRLDINARESQQSIRLVTEELTQLAKARDQTQMDLNEIKRDVVLIRAQHDNLAATVKTSQDGIKRLVWTLFGGVVTLASTIIAVLLANGPFK